MRTSHKSRQSCRAGPDTCQRKQKLTLPLAKEVKCCTFVCAYCQQEPGKSSCTCSCHRNKAVLHSLAWLFRSSVHYVTSTLCRLAFLERQSCHLNGRALENVKAPYTEAQDLDINDSIYDRCGELINPLEMENAPKVLRLLFLAHVLQPDQISCLVWMLQKLNARVYGAVNINWLVYTIATMQLQSFVCSIIRQDARAARLYNAQLCYHICHPYGENLKPKKEPKPKKPKPKKKKKFFHIPKDKPKRPTRNWSPYCTRIRQVKKDRELGSSGNSKRRRRQSAKMSGYKTRSSSLVSEKGSRRVSRSSGQQITIGTRMQGGTPTLKN